MKKSLVNENPHPLEFKPLWEAMENAFDQREEAWVETTEKMYWEMLEVLPPSDQIGAAFLVGEAWRHCPLTGRGLYACFKEESGKFFARYMTAKQFHDEFHRVSGK